MFSVVLLANKVDKPKKEVSYEQGKAVAEKHGYQFFETSAKTGNNVIEAFETVSDMVVSLLKQKEASANGEHKPQPLRAQQRNIIQKKRGLCCTVS